MQHNHCLKKWNFDLLTSTPEVSGSAAEFCDSLKCDMQHDHVLNILTFYLLTPSPGGSAGKTFATMLLHFMVSG